MWAWLSIAFATTPADVDVVLDRLHAAAAAADEATYFGLFAEDAVFIGTDATERWDLPAFRAFATPHFAEAPAWAYTPVERHVALGPRGRVAWFDEVLDHERYGRVRGSGVLVREGRELKVAQYVLSFPIPNAAAPHVLDVVHGTARLPTVYTSGQIRDAMPVGLQIHWASTQGDTRTVSVWRVVAADEDGVDIAYATEGEDGEVVKRSTWTELRDHASFPPSGTTWEEGPLDTVLGTLTCRSYTVKRDDGVQRFWFCPEVAGAPIKMTVEKQGNVVSTWELIRRDAPE